MSPDKFNLSSDSTLDKIHPLMHTYIHTYVHTYIRAYIHTYIPTNLHTYLHTYMHAYANKQTNKYIYIYICAEVWSSPIGYVREAVLQSLGEPNLSFPVQGTVAGENTALRQLLMAYRV